jgi:hypothetical protein
MGGVTGGPGGVGQLRHQHLACTSSGSCMMSNTRRRLTALQILRLCPYIVISGILKTTNCCQKKKVSNKCINVNDIRAILHKCYYFFLIGYNMYMCTLLLYLEII